MNKRILIVSLAIVLVCAMAGAGTMAYFTSQAASTGNAFETGTLTLGGVMDGQDVEETFDNVAIEHLRPGEPAVIGSTTLKNVGTLPFKLYRITADDFRLIEDSEVAAAMMEGTLGPVSWDELNNLLTLTIDIGGEHVYTGKFSQLVEENGGFFDPIYDLQKDEEVPMTMSVIMSGDAGNRYQGIQFSCDFTVYAAQNNMPNPGEPEGDRVNLGSTGYPGFSVVGYNTPGKVNFDWDWNPNDDRWYGEYEYYELKIKHETGDSTTQIYEASIKIIWRNSSELVVSCDGIDKNDVSVDWNGDIVKIDRDAFPADWDGFEVNLGGMTWEGKYKEIPYQYWSLQSTVHNP